MIVEKLYFFTDSFFDVTYVNKGEEYSVKDHIQCPRNSEAGVYHSEGGGFRIDKLHPQNSEA